VVIAKNAQQAVKTVYLETVSAMRPVMLSTVNLTLVNVCHRLPHKFVRMAVKTGKLAMVSVILTVTSKDVPLMKVTVRLALKGATRLN
jgi:hypothetical protein